jgi:hypothetical protein
MEKTTNLFSIIPKWGLKLDNDSMFYTYVSLVDEDQIDKGYKEIYKALMKIFNYYHAGIPNKAYKGIMSKMYGGKAVDYYIG